MNTIFNLTLKSATRDPFLLFWSIILPIGASVGLGIFMDSSKYTLNILTGMMATSIVFYSFINTAFTILSQRRRGVYKLLKVTPLSLTKYIFSTSSAWTLISMFCGILILLVGLIVFKLNLSLVSFIMLIPIIIISTISYVFFSFFISSLSRNESNVSILTNIIVLPLLLSSSTFYSLDKAPLWIQTINSINPFQWFINGLRNALAFNIGEYFTNILLLIVLCIISLFIAVKTFKYSN